MSNIFNITTGRRRAIFIISFLLGLFVIVQSRSFTGITQLKTRDSASNTFREIQILADTNRNLQSEIVGLEELLLKTKDNSLSLKVLEEEIVKFKVINGGMAIFGPGVVVTAPAGTEIASLVDLVNELYSSGAEAVSVNGARLSGTSFGFDTIPNGQILMRGNILQPPYAVAAIGDRTTLENALRQQGGLVQRYERHHPGKTLKILKKDRIDMGKGE